ncbi:Six-hairpin glycosidase-like protein, partial [Aspergillus carlsbadensis]
MSPPFDTSWIWHPDWLEQPTSSSAGAFVHFRKSLHLASVPAHPVKIKITADTRYKLYINSRFVHAGPVKGDQQAWFYDVLDIAPYLLVGRNAVAVHVLRFYHGSQFATSFPRCPYPGLYIKCEDAVEPHDVPFPLCTDETWETALDPCRVLPTADNLDYFLQTFETVDERERHRLAWVAAKPHRFVAQFGLTMPWNLQRRMIPFPRLRQAGFVAVHNIRGCCAREVWESLVSTDGRPHDSSAGVVLPRGTVHHVELEVPHHMTAYVRFRFTRPRAAGSTLRVTWSEGYEGEPIQLPFVRSKSDRRDSTLQIIGPNDRYVFGGPLAASACLHHDGREVEDESFAPFHYRTFRYIALDITVADSDLVLRQIELVRTNYPLDVSAVFHRVVPHEPATNSNWFHDLWQVSLRTLENCMHDCYEDCPFYEQLQYAMDTRSSALFTYQISRDDRMARQAIRQLFHSFQPALGLTAARAPSHHLQIISHFSLFWACMVTDHYESFGDARFIRPFLPVVHAVLDTFHRRLDPVTGLLRISDIPCDWEFVDWTEAYHPLGVPPAKSTGFLAYTNQLYAYTLQRVSALESCLDVSAQAQSHAARAASIVTAIRVYCFDGAYFTDGLAAHADASHYSAQSQIWAALCGAITGPDAAALLDRALGPSGSDEVAADTCRSSALPSPSPRRTLTQPSIAMSFYTLRALASLPGDGGADGDAYTKHFHRFWAPWRHQIDKLNLTTWAEDLLTQRSDCHAWGALPLYEFTAEVAGFRWVLRGGERVLRFAPRVRLFREFAAEVP